MANYTEENLAEELENQEYKFGFVTPIDSDTIPIGLSEDVIRLISGKKEEPLWLLEHRLHAYNVWKTMEEPNWANVHYKKPDFQNIAYSLKVEEYSGYISNIIFLYSWLFLF